MTTIRISGVPFDQITPQIREALDTALAGTLNLQQGAVGAANPKDTGRMSSSWQIGHNIRPQADRGEDWAQPGEKRYERLEYPLKISFGGTWYISNNVPYAQYIAYNYQPSVNQAQKDWFTSIANQTGVVFERQWRKVKP